MHVCDITREDQVVATATISFSSPNGETPVDNIILDLGQRALTAIETQDWGSLHTLTPYALRKKDKGKQAAAKKAAATKQAKRSSTAATTRPAAAHESGAVGGTALGTAETASGAASGVTDDPLSE